MPNENMDRRELDKLLRKTKRGQRNLPISRPFYSQRKDSRI